MAQIAPEPSPTGSTSSVSSSTTRPPTSPSHSTTAVPAQPPTRSPYDLNRITHLTQGNKQVQRQALLILAKSADRAERPDDVCRFIREIIRLITTPTSNPNTPTSGGSAGPTELTYEERQLLWLSYKQVIQALRSAVRGTAKFDLTSDAGGSLSPMQHSSGSHAVDELSGSTVATYSDVLDDYRTYLEREMSSVAADLVHAIEGSLLKVTVDNEQKTFYLRMAGDYYRYLAEAQPIKGYERRSLDLYAQAWRLGSSSLPVNHPTRLMVALNYSVCLYEMFRDRKAAHEIAKSAFDAAIHKLDELDENSYKDSTLVMQLIRDNLTLWQQQETQGEAK